MTDWTRQQRIELELLQHQATIGDLRLRLAVALQERDTARSLAVGLENELVALQQGIVMVPWTGDAT